MVKKTLFLTMVLMFSVLNLTSAVDLDQLFGQVKSDLLQKGVTAADVNSIQLVASNLLGLGIGKENLVNIVMGLVGLKVSGNTLNSPLLALKDLVQSGEKPSLASNLMSQVINQAKSQNLTGKDAVAKIVDFINQKKSEFLALKAQTLGKIQGQNGKIDKSIGSFLGK